MFFVFFQKEKFVILVFIIIERKNLYLNIYNYVFLAHKLTQKSINRERLISNNLYMKFS